MTPVWHSGQCHLSHYVYAGLHDFRDDGSGQLFLLSIYLALVFGFLTTSLLPLM